MNIEKCPFCRLQGPRIVIKSRCKKGIINRHIYWVECGYCGASQNHSGFMSGFKTPDRAVAAWNKVSCEFPGCK